MRRAALLLLALLLPGCGAELATDDANDDSDSAPFVVVVEHAGGRRCSGSLVSLRTVLTAAACAAPARGHPAGAGALLVRAGACGARASAELRGPCARRVARVAAARGAARDPAGRHVALLELQAPFGAEAHTRPILMATTPGECGAAGGTCHVVRSLQPERGRELRLRIVDARLAEERACAVLARHWADVRERALCLTGPRLCRDDWGAGVVCGGKLCGVVSRSADDAATAGAPEDELEPDEPAPAPGCGHTHAAHSVARWRRFLHCAHTLRACGRGDCAELCTERRLLDEEEEPRGAGGASYASDADDSRADDDASDTTTRSTSPTISTKRNSYLVVVSTVRRPTRSGPPARGATGSRAVAPLVPAQRPGGAPAPSRTAGPAATPAVRNSPVFEPNRPDFRVPSSTRVVSLKAGEYGDNAAEYGAPGDEPPAPSRSPEPEADADADADSDAEDAPAPAAAPPPPRRLAAERFMDTAVPKPTNSKEWMNKLPLNAPGQKLSRAAGVRALLPLFLVLFFLLNILIL